jgi:hypothetical protein
MADPFSRWNPRQLAFALLRMREPMHCYDGCHAGSGGRLRVLHTGYPARGSYLLESLYGEVPKATSCGRVTVAPSPPAPNGAGPGCDLELIEISRLYVARYIRAGYFVIPEWVEFGRRVIEREEGRYASASKSLKSDLHAVRRAGFDVRTSRDPDDFELFYRDMYLPSTRSRFGAAAIQKSRRRLRRDFHRGFLLLLQRDGKPAAGGIVAVERSTVRLTTIGVWRGSEQILRQGISAAIDYHLHVWAAEHKKEFISVGHTRPLPRDGVYFNKRKWQMEIEPDPDGVMSIALKWRGPDDLFLKVFQHMPFVYQGSHGLGVLCVHSSQHMLQFTEARKLVRSHWSEGLTSLIAVCPGSSASGVAERMAEECGPAVHLCADLPTAMQAYRSFC